MVTNKALEYPRGQTEENIKVIERLENNMEKE